MPVFVGSVHQVMFNIVPQAHTRLAKGKRIEEITDNHTNPILRDWVGHAKRC